MRKFILGTDWWTDCDDAIALRLLARAAKAGEMRLLGIAINACMEDSVASLKGFLDAEGVADVPVGIDRDATDYIGSPRYQKRLAQRMPNITNADAEEAVRLYRRLLAESNGPVELVEIGFLQVVCALLKSEGDDISPKSGKELFQEKVEKVWVMAGKWDADGEMENNFCQTARARIAGKEFCELCPAPVTFLGFEVGFDVFSGGMLEKDDFLYQVLADHGSAGGRNSWDPMLAMLALIGDEEKAGYETVTGTASVNAANGANHFDRDCSGKHKFVVKKYDNSFYEEQINRLI